MSSSKACFNSECTNLKPERPRKGWRLRSGEYAELCDPCASAYEEGRFCDTMHLDGTGWRSCESCGKRVHCGCIVSSYAFALLDAGGIECLICARKNVSLAPNLAWPSSSYFDLPLSERLRDHSVKNWSQLVGSGPVPWRQAPSLFNSSVPQSEYHSRVPYEVDISAGVDRYNASERFSASSLEMKTFEELSGKLMNGSLKHGTQEIYENGNSVVAGIRSEEKPDSCLNISQRLTSLKDVPSTPQYGLSVPYPSTNGQIGVPGAHLRPSPLPSLAKHGNPHNGVESSREMRNGRPRGDGRGKNQLLPQNWPRITDLELQQVSRHSNSVITPLFGKKLSASDAGKVGRWVLPKKSAEAYFPPISQPEGLPLKVQDLKGKEWIFQFRYWPNNNSRMYVLEGITPCIQSMQLQAGDIVTFSRLEPEGKLVIGFTKASTVPPSDQDNESTRIGNGVSAHGDVELADPSLWSKVDTSGYIAKEVLGAKSFTRKRKKDNLSSKSKRLRIENADMIELMITWEEAQGLLCPPPNYVASVTIIEGIEFEEYEDAPVLGRPTIFTTNNVCEKIQWAQCEDCLKWRKLPASVLLSSKWTCSDNSWDPKRSFCSATQELTTEQLKDLLCSFNSAAFEKMKASKQEPNIVESLEGLDTLANLAILGEGASSQATTKHPRHRPGCSCIVCIQPPSGKGPKHKQTCMCNVCLTVKRRFRTLMLRREKKQSEKEGETTQKRPQHQQLPFAEKLQEDETLQCTNTGTTNPNQTKMANDSSDEDPNRIKTSSSFKAQIDLNMQPEGEEDLSPGSGSRMSNSGCNENSAQQGEDAAQAKLSKPVAQAISHQDTEQNLEPPLHR